MILTLKSCLIKRVNDLIHLTLPLPGPVSPLLELLRMEFVSGLGFWDVWQLASSSSPSSCFFPPLQQTLMAQLKLENKSLASGKHFFPVLLGKDIPEVRRHICINCTGLLKIYILRGA